MFWPTTNNAVPRYEPAKWEYTGPTVSEIRERAYMLARAELPSASREEVMKAAEEIYAWLRKSGSAL